MTKGQAQTRHQEPDGGLTGRARTEGFPISLRRSSGASESRGARSEVGAGHGTEEPGARVGTGWHLGSCCSNPASDDGLEKGGSGGPESYIWNLGFTGSADGSDVGGGIKRRGTWLVTPRPLAELLVSGAREGETEHGFHLRYV